MDGRGPSRRCMIGGGRGMVDLGGNCAKLWPSGGLDRFVRRRHPGTSSGGSQRCCASVLAPRERTLVTSPYGGSLIPKGDRGTQSWAYRPRFHFESEGGVNPWQCWP